MNAPYPDVAHHGAAGLDRNGLWNLEHVQSAVRFAVDAYVIFARRARWHEAACKSLTGMFAPQIHRDRLAGWPSLSPWIDPPGLQYFRGRIPLTQRALHILRFKLDSLWSMPDAIEKAYPQ
jgi:pyrroloquinoline-quinone synthase